MTDYNTDRMVSAAIDNADRDFGTIGSQDPTFKQWMWDEYKILVMPCVKLKPGGGVFDRFNAWGYHKHECESKFTMFLLKYRGKD